MNGFSFRCTLEFWCNEDEESKKRLKQCKRFLEELSNSGKDVEMLFSINPGFYILQGTKMTVSIDTNSIRDANELAKAASDHYLLRCLFTFWSETKDNTSCGEVMWVCWRPYYVYQYRNKTQSSCNWLYSHGHPMNYYGVRMNSGKKWEEVKSGIVFPEV